LAEAATASADSLNRLTAIVSPRFAPKRFLSFFHDHRTQRQEIT